MARYEVKVLPWAVTDVRETYLYLLERDDRLAENFERRVRDAILSLGETAHRYQVRADGIRRCPLKRFPHGRTGVTDERRGAGSPRIFSREASTARALPLELDPSHLCSPIRLSSRVSLTRFPNAEPGRPCCQGRGYRPRVRPIRWTVR